MSGDDGQYLPQRAEEVRRPGPSSVVGTHNKFQPKIWKQVRGEEHVVHLDARKPQTVPPAVGSDSAPFSHPNTDENLVWETYAVYLAA